MNVRGALALVTAVLLLGGCNDAELLLVDDRYTWMWLAPPVVLSLMGVVPVGMLRARALDEWNLRARPAAPAAAGLLAVSLGLVAAAPLVVFVILNVAVPSSIIWPQALANGGAWSVGALVGATFLVAAVWYAERRFNSKAGA